MSINHVDVNTRNVEIPVIDVKQLSEHDSEYHQTSMANMIFIIIACGINFESRYKSLVKSVIIDFLINIFVFQLEEIEFLSRYLFVMKFRSFKS